MTEQQDTWVIDYLVAIFEDVHSINRWVRVGALSILLIAECLLLLTLFFFIH